MQITLRRLSLFQLIIFALVVLVVIYKGTRIISYGISYTQSIIETVNKDHERRAINADLLAQIEWNYFKLQAKHMKNICQEKGSTRKDLTWLSALVNDEYVIPAVVLGYSIQMLSCVKSMLVLISDEVSEESIKTLKQIGWTVKVVNAMDCRWLERKQGRMPHRKGILGTHTRFHAWNYTQYSKIIYADPDYMLLSSIDELFEVPDDLAAAYCARPGILDPCFNAGLLVFRPSHADYKAIMDHWWEVSASDTCPNDQVLLWHHYADKGRWKPLPFAYNVRRVIHHPMKAFHFACCPPAKPWKDICRASLTEAKAFDGPIRTVRDVSVMFWKMFYRALQKYKLNSWWKSTSFYKPKMEFRKKTYKECLVESELHPN